MLLVVAFLLLLGLTADRPGAPERDERAPPAASHTPLIRRDAPAPRDSARAGRVRLRAHAPEREEDSFRSDVTAETLAWLPSPRRPTRGSPFASAASPEPLIYAFCTLLC